MDIIQEGTTLIIRGRHLSELDLFVCRVLDILTSYSPYVIVSGYVAILFGRTRSTEDVDLLIPICDESTFLLLHDKFIELGYEFLNAENGHGLYAILASGSGIRFSEKDAFIPNIEIKFTRNESDAYSFKNRIPLIINDRTFWIGPLEMQIAYKLWLGSGKDIEDAIYIREISRDFIDEVLLRDFCSSFGVNYDPS
jgi:hypothetical protein